MFNVVLLVALLGTCYCHETQNNSSSGNLTYSGNVCYFPNLITNGRYIRTIDATTVQYQCNSRYVFSANAPDGLGTCKRGVVQLPTCIYDLCYNIKYSSYISNGRRTSRSIPNYGYRQVYYCYSGYLFSENSTTQWSHGMLWGIPSCKYGVTNIPKCVRNRCPSTIPNGYKYTYRDGYYNCSDGYELEDPSVFNCGEGRDIVVPKCEPIHCYYPSSIKNGALVQNNTSHYNSSDYDEYSDDIVEYNCSTGYILAHNSTNGTGMAPCINGTRIIPVCVGDECYEADYPVNITNGHLNTSTTTRYYKGYGYYYDRYGYRQYGRIYGYRSNSNSTVQYICNESYKLHQNSSDGVAWCENNTISYPTCVDAMDVKLVKKVIGHQVKVSFDNKTWGSICDDSWGKDDANVVCRSLGWKGGLPLRLRSNDVLRVTNFNCTGEEKSLGQCQYANYPSKYALPCKSNEVAGVKCYHEDWTFKSLIKRAKIKTKKLMSMITISFKMIIKKFDVRYKMHDYLVPTFYDSNKTQQYSAHIKYNNKSGMYKAKLALNSFEEKPCFILMVTMPLFEQYSETDFCLNATNGKTTIMIN